MADVVHEEEAYLSCLSSDNDEHDDYRRTQKTSWTLILKGARNI